MRCEFHAEQPGCNVAAAAARVAIVPNGRPGMDGRNSRVLRARNPPRVDRLLSTDSVFGLLPPSNVVVREERVGRLVVGLMEPVEVLKLSEDREVGEIAH